MCKVTGFLSQKGKFYYAVLRIPTVDGGTNRKWISTKIPVEGKSKRETAQNQKKADKFLASLLLEYESKPLESDKMLIAWIDEWLDRKKRDITPETYEGYELYARVHIKPYFEPLKLRIDEVSPRIIQKYIDTKYKDGQSANSLKKHLVVLKGTFNDAIDLEAVNVNPCDRVKLPKLVKHEGHAYTPEQAKELIAAIKDDPMESAIILALYLGLRRSEVLGLRWQDVDFENNIIRIRNTVVRMKTTIEHEHTKSNASRRDMFIPLDLKKYLIGLKDQQEDMKEIYGESYKDTGKAVIHVVVWPDGRPLSPDYLSKHFPALLKKHRLPKITFHELRHTCGSLLLGEGKSVMSIKQYLGHEDVSITMSVYLHPTVEDKVDSANCLNDLLTTAN